MKNILILFCLTLSCACVQRMRDITIQFAVDMNHVEDVETIGVIGESKPLNWQNAIPLNDSDGDGIYEGKIIIKAAYNYAEFKFKLNDQIIELEGQGNRIISFKDKTKVNYSGVFDQPLL